MYLRNPTIMITLKFHLSLNLLYFTYIKLCVRLFVELLKMK